MRIPIISFQVVDVSYLVDVVADHDVLDVVAAEVLEEVAHRVRVGELELKSFITKFISFWQP